MFESPITYVNFTKELLNMLQFLKALFITILFLGVASCANSQKNEASVDSTDHKFTNELINETSPYLLQHAHNPVNWRPWGEEAFEKAQEEDKLVLISIGYSSCHWCHVMEHESFEDEDEIREKNSDSDTIDDMSLYDCDIYEMSEGFDER